MPRKTKETIEEETPKIKKKTTKISKKESSIDLKLANEEETKEKTTAKKATTKKLKKVADDVEKTTKKATKTKESKAKEDKTKKKATKTTTKKATTKTSKTTKATKTKKTTTKKRATKKEVVEEIVKTLYEELSLDENGRYKTSEPMEVEYYDLPYKYNETVVKVLYKNSSTLFVYWEISDDDIENYKRTYGDNFFETTEPVLRVYNESMNYRFEIVINDYANSWYFNINDAKCKYHVELGRRPKYNSNIGKDYIYVSSSNSIESPNDRILFNTNENNSIYFRNVKNNQYRKLNLSELIDKLNLKNKDFGFPLIKNISDLYKQLYDVENIFDFDIISNPSSGNPSSGSLSSQFK